MSVAYVCETVDSTEAATASLACFPLFLRQRVAFFARLLSVQLQSDKEKTLGGLRLPCALSNTSSLVNKPHGAKKGKHCVCLTRVALFTLYVQSHAMFFGPPVGRSVTLPVHAHLPAGEGVWTGAQTKFGGNRGHKGMEIDY